MRPKLPPPLSSFHNRQHRLRVLMDEHQLPALLVTHLPNVRYLTGFHGSAGMALITPRQGVLWVDPRYTLQAQEQSKGVEVVEEKKGILKGVGTWLSKNGVGKCGFEPSCLTYAQFEQLRKEAGEGVTLLPASDLIEQLRAIKDAQEIAAIRKAAKVTDAAFQETLAYVRPGAVEQDLAAEIEYRMRRHGAEGAAFETIVASGTRAALPHARPSAKALQESELVIFDLGAILSGYAADMTRTVFLGEPARRVRSLYSAVLAAQAAGVRSVKDGVSAGEVDAATRLTLAKHRLARFFTHSTGHGVGLEIHERPRVAKGDATILKAGAVVTVEPGIYLPGLGGIRIEDTVLVGADGPEVLTSSSKDHWMIG